MTKYFDALSQDELGIVKSSFAHIALLIGGADGKFSESEKEEAHNTIKVRGYEANHLFHELYDDINSTFLSDLDTIASQAASADEASDFHAQAISKVNPILSKLPKSTAYRLYKDYLSFAHRIANSDGGILGFGSINNHEKRFLKLPMILPIEQDEEE